MNKIPIIGAVVEQKLVVTFKKNDTAGGEIAFSFEPDIIDAISPEQRAAVNVAQQIIQLFGLDQPQPEGQVNGNSIQ